MTKQQRIKKPATELQKMSLTTVSSEEQRLIELSNRNTKFEREDLVIPRLKILQPLNPEVEEDGPKHIDGAKPGMFFNTSSGKLTSGKTGLIVCIIGHQRQAIEWVPRNAGGGLVKIWGQDEGWRNLCTPETVNDFVPKTTDGHIIAKVRQFLLFDIDPETGDYDPSFFNMQGTQTRIAASLSSMLLQAKMKIGDKSYTAPFYYYTYKMTLDMMRNDKGTWYSPRITKNMNGDGKHLKTLDLPNGKEIFETAVVFQEQFLEGTIQQTSWEDNQQTQDSNSF